MSKVRNLMVTRVLVLRKEKIFFLSPRDVKISKVKKTEESHLGHCCHWYGKEKTSERIGNRVPTIVSNVCYV